MKVSTNRLPPRSWQSGRKANTASASPICISSKSPGMPRLVSHLAITLTVTSHRQRQEQHAAGQGQPIARSACESTMRSMPVRRLS